jgi:hypothetical protein
MNTTKMNGDTAVIFNDDELVHLRTCLALISDSLELNRSIQESCFSLILEASKDDHSSLERFCFELLGETSKDLKLPRQLKVSEDHAIFSSL